VRYVDSLPALNIPAMWPWTCAWLVALKIWNSPLSARPSGQPSSGVCPSNVATWSPKLSAACLANHMALLNVRLNCSDGWTRGRFGICCRRCQGSALERRKRVAVRERCFSHLAIFDFGFRISDFDSTARDPRNRFDCFAVIFMFSPRGR